MHPALAILALILGAQATTPTARVVGTIGTVIRKTADGDSAIRGLQPLTSGDGLATEANAGAIVEIRPGGNAVYLGSNALVTVEFDAPALSLIVEQGEVYCTSNGTRPVRVQTPLAYGEMPDGSCGSKAAGDVVWYRAVRKPLTITLDDEALANTTRRGIRRVVFQDGPKTMTLNEGQQVRIESGKGFGAPEAIDPSLWEIDPLQLAAEIAANLSRLGPDALTRGPEPQSTAPPFQDPAGTGTSQTSIISNQVGTSSSVGQFGGMLASTSSSSAAGLNVDANQKSLSGMLTDSFRGLAAGDAFAGNVHLVSGETRYTLGDITLQPSDAFPNAPEYWSIGTGASPAGQVVTDFATGTNPTPTALRIPHFDAYVVRLDQFGISDPTNPAGGGAASSVTGLVGSAPLAPSVQGATPLLDERAELNDRATFALGEFRVARNGNSPQLSMRRSDQDRRIVKDTDGNDNLDQITPNSQVTTFVNAPDPRFFPQNPEVYSPVSGPNGLNNLPRYGSSTTLRQAAFTVLTAQELSGFARRTGQTRFVVDGRILDITGFKGR